MLNTPVLFLIFNRPDTTKLVFEQIRIAQPKYLFIAADGPRVGNENDQLNCILVRKAVLESINWECEVKTLLRDENLGCGKAVSEAITWFFKHVEEGIILEDDCLPHQDFFLFCEKLLVFHKYDENVFQIGGTNVLLNKKKFKDLDYFFSKYPVVWGWATWKRTWELYDFELKNFDKDIYLIGKNLLKTKSKNSWTNNFIELKKGNIDTWDYQLAFLMFKNQGLCAVPNYNLISNIGHGENATHTKHKNIFSCLKLENFQKNIVINKKVTSHKIADRLIDALYNRNKTSFIKSILIKIKMILNV